MNGTKFIGRESAVHVSLVPRMFCEDVLRKVESAVFIFVGFVDTVVQIPVHIEPRSWKFDEVIGPKVVMRFRLNRAQLVDCNSRLNWTQSVPVDRGCLTACAGCAGLGSCFHAPLVNAVRELFADDLLAALVLAIGGVVLCGTFGSFLKHVQAALHPRWGDESRAWCWHVHEDHDTTAGRVGR
jgi:hypothetical protein